MLDPGELGVRQAAALVEAVTPLPDEAASEVAVRVLSRACLQTAAAFRRSLRRAVLRTDPRDAQVRHEQACRQREVRVRAGADGMAELYALLPAVEAAELWSALCSAADGAAPDERTVGERRADALVGLVTGSSDSAVHRGGRDRARVNVTVALSTLLDLDDDPAELDGQGTITAHVARRVAFDAGGVWRRIVTDGPVVVEASRAYEPPPRLAEHVIARDRTCRFPNCPRRARRCEIDHRIPWPEGPTSAENLECLCARHHHLKHEAGWAVRAEPDDTIVWTSPTGRVYRAPPDDAA